MIEVVAILAILCALPFVAVMAVNVLCALAEFAGIIDDPNKPKARLR